MFRVRTTIVSLAVLGCLAASTVSANAACVKYGAKATAGSEKSAKWFVMETIVQQVSWGIWPAYLADGSTPGYTVKGERYKCTKSGTSVTCIGQATFCKKK